MKHFSGRTIKGAMRERMNVEEKDNFEWEQTNGGQCNEEAPHPSHVCDKIPPLSLSSDSSFKLTTTNYDGA